MPSPQYTVSAAMVQHQVEHLLTPVLGPWPTVRRCTVTAVCLVLAYAAARLTSLAAACARLRNAPGDDAVRNALIRQLPDIHVLERRLQAALTDHLPRAVRRCRRWIVALDLVLIPYHGQPFRDTAEVYRGQPKSGTTHFHAYATAYLCLRGRRFTLALMVVRHKTPMRDVVRELCRRVTAAGVTPRLLLLDRGFDSAGVIRYLQHARRPFIVPKAVHGRAPAAGRPLKGLRLIRATAATGWTRYTWQPKGERRVTVDLCVVRRRRRDRRGGTAFLYACWGVSSGPRWVKEIYRRRFGIETSYRQAHQGRIRTSTRRPALRLLFVGIGLLLRNVWAWLHWVALARRRRGGRTVQWERLRLRTMLDWLAHRAEAVFGTEDWIPAEAQAVD
jgi:Transposase DDE domain